MLQKNLASERLLNGLEVAANDPVVADIQC